MIIKANKVGVAMPDPKVSERYLISFGNEKDD